MEKLDLITYSDPKSPISEAYRTLRTNIQFSSFDKEIKTIMVTSSGPEEGKSTTAANIAVTMAQSGKKTILIDCDQRKARLHKIFNISNQKGISDVLAGVANLEQVLFKTQVENLYILPAGTVPPNPSELLGSSKMGSFIDSLKETVDYIIIDTPPVIAVTDAQLVSQFADGCILVVASQQVNRDAVMKAKNLLEKVNAKILGVVLNKVEMKKRGYYGYYSYYYGSDGKKHKVKK